MAKNLNIAPNSWYQIKISLNDITPEIWRRFIVASDIILPDLHKVIQTVMGWTNSHLHQFIIDGTFYSEPDDDSFFEYVDYRDIRLNQVLTEEEKRITYEYDFGDGWEHEILLEKILSDHNQKYPSCLEGQRSCPPEDCGGPFGYQDLLEALAAPGKAEHKEMLDWLGDDFDPEYINIKKINMMLKRKDYGCLTVG